MSADVLGDLMRGSLDHCVKCTICETFCPVSNVTPLFPGPKYAGPQAERFRVEDTLPVVLVWEGDGRIDQPTLARIGEALAEPVGTGTRSAYPSSLPLSSGSTRPMAFAAPVEVGTMLLGAERARLGSL